MKRTFLLLMTLCLLLIPTMTLAEYDFNSKEFQAVISKLDMQGHANDDYATCTVKQMYYEEVLEMLQSGMSSEEILQFYVDEYGQAALREPARDKSGLIAWGMPVIGLVSGAAIVAFMIRKMKGKPNEVNDGQDSIWESEIDKEVAEKLFDEERRKHF